MSALPTPRLTATLTHHAGEQLARVTIEAPDSIEAPADAAWQRLLRKLARAVRGGR